jgi:hypothetical protein
MNRKRSTARAGVLPLQRMALRFYDEAHEATGDERHAAMIASVAYMAAVDRLRDRRVREARAVAKTG